MTTVVNNEAAKSLGKRPQRPSRDAMLEKVKAVEAKIEELQTKLFLVKDQINGTSLSPEKNDKLSNLKQKLSTLREEQSEIKKSRTTIFNQISTLQASLKKKKSELDSIFSKTNFKSLDALEDQIDKLESKVESGTLKIIEEKKALTEISQLKKFKRSFTNVTSLQEGIDADNKNLDQLRALLNDSKSESISNNYDSVKNQLDDLYKDDQSVRQDKSKLYAKRDELQKDINALYDEKRGIQSEYRNANESYAVWKRENETRKKEEEEKQKLQDEQDRLNELIAEEREAAEAPAFESELNLCNGLLSYFGTILNQELVKSTETTTKANNLPTLNIRKVEDSEAPKGFVVKKKDDSEDNYFKSSKPKKKANKKDTQNAKPIALKIPLGVMESLFSLKIQAPLSVSEVQTTVEKIQEKKQYYLDNQERVTEEKKAKLEAKFTLLSEKLKQLKIAPSSGTSAPVVVANGDDAKPISAE